MRPVPLFPAFITNVLVTRCTAHPTVMTPPLCLLWLQFLSFRSFSELFKTLPAIRAALLKVNTEGFMTLYFGGWVVFVGDDGNSGIFELVFVYNTTRQSMLTKETHSTVTRHIIWLANPSRRRSFGIWPRFVQSLVDNGDTEINLKDIPTSLLQILHPIFGTDL